MDLERDYYADLGVLPDVSREVIRAVYLALAKRFHPDTGGEHADQEKFKTINAAYEILYDEIARGEYDEGRTKHQQSSYNRDVEDEEDLIDDELAGDWETAVEYYPDLEKLRMEISAISSALSVVFQGTILGNKNFEAAAKVKQEIIEQFVERYFGKNEIVKQFALEALKNGRRDVAKELNRAVRVLGGSLDPKTVFPKIIAKFAYKTEVNFVDDVRYRGYRIELNNFSKYVIYLDTLLYSGANTFSSIDAAKRYIDRNENLT
jgi:curved DNA-binding protein CbpA